MAKTITRKFLNLFGNLGATTNFAKFGSSRALAVVKTKDIDVIQSLDAWKNGLQDSIFSANKAPFLEEMNALHYVHSYMTAYLMQEGISEWSASQTYYVGSVCRAPGSMEIYQSKIDDNTNNALPNQADNTQWIWFSRPAIAPGLGMDCFSDVLPPGRWLWCDGSAISRITYAALFAYIGTFNGPGDGFSTFNLPDTRGRVTMGAGAGVGLTNRLLAQKLGEESHILTLAEMPSHAHGVNDPGHQHTYPTGVGSPGDNGIPTRDGDGNTPDRIPQTSHDATGVTIAATGGGVAHNNIQPSLVCNKIISY